MSTQIVATLVYALSCLDFSKCISPRSPWEVPRVTAYNNIQLKLLFLFVCFVLNISLTCIMFVCYSWIGCRRELQTGR